jgi:hypothetical protein
MLARGLANKEDLSWSKVADQMDKNQSVDRVGRTETAIEWSVGKSRESVFARERWLIPQRIDAVISL